MSARMQAEFEAEFKRKFPLTYQAALSGESKAHGDLSNAWWGWEASRQALEVEFPESPYLPESEPASMTGYEIGEAQGRCDMWQECKEAIRAAGIRIKGDV